MTDGPTKSQRDAYAKRDVISHQSPDRDAMPAGHFVSWGAIIRGMSIDGAAYPAPVFRQ